MSEYIINPVISRYFKFEGKYRFIEYDQYSKEATLRGFDAPIYAFLKSIVGEKV